MSRIRANELTDTSGNDLSTPRQIAQGRAKAWFNLNGTGTIAERDSFNVSSYVDNGVGDYTSNWAAAMPNANYAPQLLAMTTFLVDVATRVINQFTTHQRSHHSESAGMQDTSQLTCSIDGD